jgi:hypothetical protein
MDRQDRSADPLCARLDAMLSELADAVAVCGSCTRDQIMADTLVERLTGQAAAADVNVELQLLMPLDELLNPNTPTAAEMACDASIRHLDHVHRRVDGGPTTMANGRGLCERGNYVHEMPGWQATVIEEGRHGHPHTVVITTPTGHSYTSSAPQPP